MGFLAGKRALIVGLATERSIAHGIASAMRREGADLAFSYQDRFKDRVIGMAAEFGTPRVAARSPALARTRSPITARDSA